MDFNNKILFEESLIIYKEFNGFFSRLDLRDMAFDEYENIITKIKEMRSQNAE